MNEGFVLMRHPETGHEAEVSREAFDAVYGPMGHVIVDEGDTGDQRDLTELSATELKSLARDRGLATTGTKEELIARLEEPAPSNTTDLSGQGG